MDEKEWRDLVWGELKELKQEIKELRSENHAILETMTTLKVKFGVIMSVFSSAVSFGVSYFYKKFGAE